MSDLLRAASDRFVYRARPLVRAFALQTALVAVAGILLLAAAGFLIAAAAVALIESQGPIAGCAILAVGFGIAGGLFLLLARANRRPERVAILPESTSPWIGLLSLATSAGLSELFLSQRRARVWAPVVLGLGALTLNSALRTARGKG